jgi:hypothetical protein
VCLCVPASIRLDDSLCVSLNPWLSLQLCVSVCLCRSLSIPICLCLYVFVRGCVSGCLHLAAVCLFHDPSCVCTLLSLCVYVCLCVSCVSLSFYVTCRKKNEGTKQTFNQIIASAQKFQDSCKEEMIHRLQTRAHARTCTFARAHIHACIHTYMACACICTSLHAHMH